MKAKLCVNTNIYIMEKLFLAHYLDFLLYGLFCLARSWCVSSHKYSCLAADASSWYES